MRCWLRAEGPGARWRALRFSQPHQFEQHTWEECNGVFDQSSDCLTDKGFSVGLHTLAAGLEVDIYNSHFDAGGSDGDHAAREAQTETRRA